MSSAASIQKDLDRVNLDRVDRNTMKFGKAKYEVLHCGSELL